VAVMRVVDCFVCVSNARNQLELLEIEREIVGLGKMAYSLPGILREVVRRHECACNALVETRPAVVRCVYDRVLEATRVLEVEVQLAGARVVCLSGAGADVGLELVEAVGDDLEGKWSVSIQFD
jgi:hypothetical protein